VAQALTLYAKLEGTSRAEATEMQSAPTITRVTFPGIVKSRRVRRPAMAVDS